MSIITQYLKAASRNRSWISTVFYTFPAIGFVAATGSDLALLDHSSALYLPWFALAIGLPALGALRLLGKAMVLKLRDQYRIFHEELRMRG